MSCSLFWLTCQGCNVIGRKGNPEGKRIVFTSEWISENINDQDITHTPKDNLGIAAPERLPEVARGVVEMVGVLG